MALTSAAIYSSLTAARASGPLPFSGPNFDLLMNGVAQAVFAWAISQPANVQLIGASTGTAGAGTILAPTTRILVPPNIPLVVGSLAGVGVGGPNSASLAAVIAMGISSAFTTYAQYTGTVAGVGAGLDVSKVTIANAATLVPLLRGFIGGSMGGVGPVMGQVSVGLANAISGLLLGGTGTGTVTGATGPSPAAGISTSVVV